MRNYKLTEKDRNDDMKINKITFYTGVLLFISVNIMGYSFSEDEMNEELMLDILAQEVEQRNLFQPQHEVDTWFQRWMRKTVQILQLKKVGLLCVQSYISARESLIKIWKKLLLLSKNTC